MTSTFTSGAPQILKGFKDPAILWQGDDPPYPSETSARWAIRQIKPQLIEAGGLARHRGRILIDPEKFREIVEKRAILGGASHGN